jgi:hypothetical protein
MLVVADPHVGVGPATLDDATWETIRDNPALECFHGFWSPLNKTEQVVPALGCSTLTFPGSAPDLACLAGSFVSLLAGHVTLPPLAPISSSPATTRGADGGGHHFIACSSQGT